MASDARTARPGASARTAPARTPAPAPARAGAARGRVAPGSRALEVPAPRGGGRPPGPPLRRAGGRRRVGLITIVIAVVLAVFAARLVWVQGITGAATATKARDARLTSVTTLGLRGQITDANGVALASSVIRYDISVNQQDVADFVSHAEGTPDGAAGVAASLAPLLGMDAAELGGQLVGDRKFKYIKKDVLPEVAREIRALGLPGVMVDQVASRVYPNGTLGGNLLGYVNSSGEGLAGLEQEFDSKLEGKPGTDEYERGKHGQPIPGGYEHETAARPGDSLELTIDSDIQYHAEHALDAQVAAMGASSGTAIVVNAKTGEILAMADSKTIDPNNPGDHTGSLTPAISDVFEPGSTGKIVTMANVLEHGVATPTSQFQVPDTLTMPHNEVFHDSETHGVEQLTLTGILAQSSNVGTVMVGQNLPKQTRYDYLAKFGFGSKTGVELPNESKGILHPADQWDGRSEYAALFGQSVSVTALQAVEVFATVANGGVRIQPHLVKGWTAPDGTFTPAPAAPSSRVIEPDTAKTLLTMMQSVVDDGTGTSAAVPGYLIAGKTGTAQAWDENGRAGITASFIGVAPADDPQIAVAVIVHNPTASVYGGTVAAPVFADLTGYTLGRLGIAPSGAQAQLFPTTW